MKARFAVAQLCSTYDKDVNFKNVEKLCLKAFENKVDFISFPENFAFLGDSKHKVVDYSEYLDGKLFKNYTELSKKYNLWISYGGFCEKISKEKIYNSHIIVDNKGQIKEIYRKIHLFDVEIENGPKLKESDYVQKGSEIKTCDFQNFKLGMSICYDLRFPELYTLLRKKNSNVLLIPSAFTEFTGRSHWHILIRSRAIENQSVVLAPAQTGKHNETRESYGHSLIVNSWGEILCELKNENDLGWADIELEDIIKIRNNMPVFNHRDDNVYQLSEK